MNDEPSRLRGTRLLLARVAALSLSLGILVVLMVRAGGGCRAEEATVVPEPRSAEAVATAPPVSSAAPAATAPVSSAAPAVSAPLHFFPGSKAMGGSIVVPPPRAQPAPSGSVPFGIIFPGTKASPHIVDPAGGGR